MALELLEDATDAEDTGRLRAEMAGALAIEVLEDLPKLESSDKLPSPEVEENNGRSIERSDNDGTKDFGLIEAGKDT